MFSGVTNAAAVRPVFFPLHNPTASHVNSTVSYDEQANMSIRHVIRSLRHVIKSLRHVIRSLSIALMIIMRRFFYNEFLCNFLYDLATWHQGFGHVSVSDVTCSEVSS